MSHFNFIVNRSVHAAEFIKGYSEALFSRAPGDEGYNLNEFIPSHLFALLYAKKMDGNNLYQVEWCADLSIKMIDRWVAPYLDSKKNGEQDFTSEWPIGVIPNVIGLLGDKVNPTSLSKWSEFLSDYCLWASQKPLGISAPNHEIWRCFGMYKSGVVLNNESFKNTALAFAKQMLKFQTPHGFWEEGPHHGPSMYFNFRLIVALAHLYQLSKDEELLEPLKKLVKFMVDYSYPDGTTVGAFDGRQPTHFGDHCPIIAGYELIPEGRTMNFNSVKFDEVEAVHDKELSGEVLYKRYSVASGFASLTLQYYYDFLSEDERQNSIKNEVPLAIEKNNKLTISDPYFKGSMHRKDGFVVALSGHDSQIPKIVKSEYRLDRQSRLEVWHDKHKLIIGGGHNLRGWNLPYANVIMDTGLYGDSDFGLVNHIGHDKRRNYFLAKCNSINTEVNDPNLAVHFGHGTVNFKIEFLSEDSFIIKCDFKTFNLKRLCLQFPFFVYKGSVTNIDGQEYEKPQTHIPVKNSYSTSGGKYNTTCSVLLPDNLTAKIHHKMSTTIIYHSESNENKPSDPTWINLLAIQYEGASAESGSFDIKVKLS